MTARDYVRSLHIFRQKGMSFVELASRSIAEVQPPALNVFQHPDFQPVDAEDTVYQLCLQFLRGDAEYIPVVDPDNGNLVAVLGLLDILFLLHQISQDFPNLFSFTLQQLAIGTFEGILTAPSGALLADVLGVMDEKGLAFVPVLEEGTGQLVGLYQRSDIGFMTKAADPDAVISTFGSIKIDAVLKQQSSADLSTPGAQAIIAAPSQALVTCILKSTLKEILETMMTARSSAISCIDESGKFLGILSIRDIINYYCHN
jgi:CBS domain-containing protein